MTDLTRNLEIADTFAERFGRQSCRVEKIDGSSMPDAVMVAYHDAITGLGMTIWVFGKQQFKGFVEQTGHDLCYGNVAERFAQFCEVD